MRASASAAYSVTVDNGAAGKRLQLEDAFDSVLKALEGNDAGMAQRAIKNALTAIHELEDRRRDGDWSQNDWTKTEIETWAGYLGARNAVHHRVAKVISLNSNPDSDDRLTWELTADEVDKNTSKTGKVEYRTLLAGQPVIPGMRAILKGVARSV